jgi:hypothetical protein
MPFGRGRRERGTAVVYVAPPVAAEIVTGRLVDVDETHVTMEDDAGRTRAVERPRAFRATPDHLARLRALQVTDQLLRDQFDALLAEMERL